MEKEFIPYELAVKMKALGFDEPCFAFYGGGKDFYIKGQHKNTTLAPTIGPTVPLYQQAFRWVMQFPQIKKYRYNVALYSDGTYSLKEGKEALYEYLSAESCLERLIEIIESK